MSIDFFSLETAVIMRDGVPSLTLTDKYTDVIFQVEDKQFKAHKGSTLLIDSCLNY